MTASQLVPVVPGTIGNVQCLTVEGRTLHGVLGVRRDFSNWIKGRISKYGFIESQDFEVFAKTGENSDLEEHLDRSRRLAQELVPCARLGINIMRDLALGQGR